MIHPLGFQDGTNILLIFGTECWSPVPGALCHTGGALCPVVTHIIFTGGVVVVVMMRGSKRDDETTNLNQKEHRGIPHTAYKG